MMQPNRWSCLPTSLAIVLKVPVQTVFDILGHDGSKIVWPDFDEPQKRKAFSLEEMIYVADKFNRHLVVHAKKWQNTPDGVNVISEPCPQGYYEDKLKRYDGVITGVTTQGKRHAVAWLEGRIIDPTNGLDYQHFQGQEEYFLACCP